MLKGEIQPVQLPNLQQAGIGAETLLHSAWQAKEASRGGLWRFGGKVGSEIRLLRDRGLGSEIGGPRVPVQDLDAEPDPANYESRIYALEMARGIALLLLPRGRGTATSYDHVLVSEPQDAEPGAFTNYFGDADTALSVLDWEQQSDETPLQAFTRQVHLFPIDPDAIEVPEAPLQEELYRTAIKKALFRAMGEVPGQAEQPATVLELPRDKGDDMRRAS